MFIKIILFIYLFSIGTCFYKFAQVLYLGINELSEACGYDVSFWDMPDPWSEIGLAVGFSIAPVLNTLMAIRMSNEVIEAMVEEWIGQINIEANNDDE